MQEPTEEVDAGDGTAGTDATAGPDATEAGTETGTGTGTEIDADADELVDPFVPVRNWDDAFARFEVELQVAVERATHPVPWRPPIALGPIPPELVERAARILEAQLHAIRYLEDVRQTHAKHAAAIDMVHDESAPHPVYFDLLGPGL